MRALDVATGATAWETALPEALATTATGVAFSGDDLLVSHLARFPFSNPLCDDITRLDADTGDVIGTPIASPILTTGLVTWREIVVHIDSQRCTTPSGTARLVVRDRTTLETLWTAGIDSTEISIDPVVADGRIYTNGLVFPAEGCGAPTCTGTPTAAPSGIAHGGRLFGIERFSISYPPPDPVQLDYGSVRVHDAATGAEQWRDDYGSEDGPARGSVNSLSVTDDMVYATTWELGDSVPGRLAAYPVDRCGAAHCDPAWTAPGPMWASHVAVAGDVVYTLSGTELNAYDAHGCGAATCEALRTITLPDAGRTLIVSGGHVIVTQETNAGTPRPRRRSPPTACPSGSSPGGRWRRRRPRRRLWRGVARRRT